MSASVTSCQSEVPSSSPSAAFRSSNPVIVRMAGNPCASVQSARWSGRTPSVAPETILGPVPNPLLAVDGPAVLYRSFFALPDSITDDDGHPVNALLGSVNQVLWCVEKYDPRAVVWCFGAEAGEYRVEAYPDYHADRPPMPDPLEWQWERAPQVYEALNWSVAATPDLEADDLLHSLAAVETAAGGRTLILTADRDMFQCASDTVSVLLQRTGGEGPG